MNGSPLPPEPVMMKAFMTRDTTYDGVFVTAVHTTGIFCRPTCPARKPLPENISFYSSPRDALLRGFRPCRRCRPMESPGSPPEWLRPLVEEVEADPSRRWTEGEVRARGLSPERVRRWFKRHHGMTFHAYSRARRLAAALGQMKAGAAVTHAAFSSGFDSLSGFNEAFRKLFGESPVTARTTEVLTVDRIPTPLGPMLAGATDEALSLLEFVDRPMLPTQISRIRKRARCTFVSGRNEVTREAARQIDEYFTGRRRTFGIPLRPLGTPFQLLVWRKLADIPYGETWSYARLAREIGRPSAVRAVGRANGSNALGIVIPCHRVVGADGRLTGYGGGLWRKRRLLELEMSAKRQSD